jgi:hypothetical protein
MARVQLQFHATADELATELVPRWLSGNEYFYALRRPDGSIVDKRGKAGPLSIDGSLDDVAEVIVRLTPFEPSTGSALDFLRHNPGILVVSLPKERDGALREAAIGSVTDDPPSVEVWRTVVRRAEGDLRNGAIATRMDGTRFVDREHRFTAGAAALSEQGVRMLAIAGGIAYDLVDLSLLGVGTLTSVDGVANQREGRRTSGGLIDLNTH